MVDTGAAGRSHGQVPKLAILRASRQLLSGLADVQAARLVCGVLPTTGRLVPVALKPLLYLEGFPVVFIPRPGSVRGLAVATP